jgi:DNA polymerase-3 subunit delta
MAKAVPSIDFLAQAEPSPPQPIYALFGEEPFLLREVRNRLRTIVLGDGEGEFSFTAFDGSTVELKDVLDELSTMAMFGGGKRLVVVDEADAFVTRYRAELEDYVARPASGGVLVLSLRSFPSNTRLYKAVLSAGMAIECSAPPTARLAKWIADWGAQSHKLRISSSAAEMLLDIIGPELGLLDQELAKLALVAGGDRKITDEMVQQMVGGWRAKTTWVMLDAALAGDAAAALAQLDRLLSSGETPVGLLGQISASLRRLAAATRLILRGEATGRRIALRDALELAGVRSFVLQKTERELRRLGRNRGSQLYHWLLEADLDLKGDSSLSPRLILERLILRLAAAEAPSRRP